MRVRRRKFSTSGYGLGRVPKIRKSHGRAKCFLGNLRKYQACRERKGDTRGDRRTAKVGSRKAISRKNVLKKTPTKKKLS